MMAAAFDDARRICAVAIGRREPRAFRTVTVLALLALVAIPLVGGIALVRHNALPIVLLLRILLGIGGFWLGIVWTMVFVPGSVLMNSAANARLLPRQRRRLYQLAVAGCVLATLAVTAAFGKKELFPLVAMYIIGFALMCAGNLHAVFLTVLPGFWSFLARHLIPAPLLQFLSSDAGALAASAVTLCAMAWALGRLYPAGGDKFLAARAGQIQRMKGIGSMNSSGREPHGPVQMFVPRAYAAVLRADCRAARPRTLLLHALGPGASWTAWLGAVLALLLVNLGLHVLIAVRGVPVSQSFFDGLSWGGLSGLVVMLAFGTAQVRQALDKTRGEQALLRLAPLAGDMALLNRYLANGLLKNALIQIAMMTAAVLALAPLFSDAGAVLLRQFALCCLGAQMALAYLFGDYARTPKPGVAQAVLLALLAAFELALAFGLGWLSGNPATWMWYWLPALAAGIGAWQVRRGWMRLLAAPVAFPAGRLS